MGMIIKWGGEWRFVGDDVEREIEGDAAESGSEIREVGTEATEDERDDSTRGGTTMEALTLRPNLDTIPSFCEKKKFN